MNLMETELCIFICGAAIFNCTVIATDIVVSGGNPLVAVLSVFGIVFCGICFAKMMRRREKLMNEKSK